MTTWRPSVLDNRGAGSARWRAYLAKRNHAITRSTVERTPMIATKINFSSRNTSSRINRKSWSSNCKLGIRLLRRAAGKECGLSFVTRNQRNWLARLAIVRRRKLNGGGRRCDGGPKLTGPCRRYLMSWWSVKNVKHNSQSGRTCMARCES